MENISQYSNSPSTPPDKPLRFAKAISASSIYARSHGYNCHNLSEHAGLVGKTLDAMKGTFLMDLDVIKEEVLDKLEDVLTRGAELVESCRVKSVFYLVATGWNVVYKFREVHEEIDRSLNSEVLISLMDEFRMQHLKDAIEATQNDNRQYSLDDEDMEFQRAILKPDRTRKDADIIEMSLSRSYPDMEIEEALREERRKLQVELERFTTNNDPKLCRLVEHLIDVTVNTANDFPTRKAHKLVTNAPTYVISGYITNAGAITDALKLRDQGLNYWQTDLFDCCREPCLSLKTCMYPCGLSSHIAFEATKGEVSRDGAINTLLAYSLFCCCCCYTCWTRRKLRELFNIEGNVCDDFLTHLMCCCCALVQEWREIELRGLEGDAGAPEGQCLVHEANTRVRDPMYGCVGVISYLQNQVAQLQMQLTVAQAEILCIQVPQDPIVMTFPSPIMYDHLAAADKSFLLHNQNLSFASSSGNVTTHESLKRELLWARYGFLNEN